MRRLFILIIQGYRYLISPIVGSNCRFYPSCSCYALTAVERYGALKGGWLSVKRVSRCHPWHPGGVDPVPEPNQERSHG
ncbi:membrane protein insertion efficiency factor YidD [Solemya pervernicosa gill symbiont]|uniref:Putative membrane protein insertion efficiency factor n=2 Tax=Gammaproteobacteria incertae sedis TaxID=118884 RepID=A0A1T2L577_9GAMM|nr:membrane protein insertion efficiency factor YidD [Candidatus Reidiella endopervernicosa]OOZ40086.1 membrane protein insertion efficiency factor YidD [Solemya pervernicosa gill symbiont]QKQ25400.1 membrane protein insertion efficiency factor YidD [Candidatus Reidiella endopervernicosa]